MAARHGGHCRVRRGHCGKGERVGRHRIRRAARAHAIKPASGNKARRAHAEQDWTRGRGFHVIDEHVVVGRDGVGRRLGRARVRKSCGGRSRRGEADDGDGGRREGEGRGCGGTANQGVRRSRIRLGVVGRGRGLPRVVVRIERPDVGGGCRNEWRQVDAGAVGVGLVLVDHGQGQSAVRPNRSVGRQRRLRAGGRDQLVRPGFAAMAHSELIICIAQYVACS